MKNVIFTQGILTIFAILAKMVSLSVAFVSISIFVTNICIFLIFQNRFLNNDSQSKTTLFATVTLLCLQLIVFYLGFNGALNIMYIACGITLIGTVLILLINNQNKEVRKKYLLYSYTFFNFMWIPTLFLYVMEK